MEKPLSSESSKLPWLYRKSPFLFELLVFVFGWVAVGATFRLHRVGQPVVPLLLEAIFMGLAVVWGTRLLRWKKDEQDHTDG